VASKRFSDLEEFFKASYTKDVPVNLVYRAGYSGSEKVVRTNLDELKSAWDKEQEKSLVLLLIGPCLDASAKANRH
jgi:precorrin-4 methylase